MIVIKVMIHEVNIVTYTLGASHHLKRKRKPLANNATITRVKSKRLMKVIKTYKNSTKMNISYSRD